MSAQNNELPWREPDSRNHGRDYWLRRAFLPGLLALPGFWIGFWLGDSPAANSIALGLTAWGGFTLAAVIWTGVCSVKLSATTRHPSQERLIVAGLGWFLMLAAANFVMAVVLIFTSCGITNNFILH